MKPQLMACLMLFGFLSASYQGASQNLLHDGTFTTTTSITPLEAPTPLNTWCFYYTWPAVTNFNSVVTNGVCKFSFLNTGNNSWDVQLIQFGFGLIPGNRYKLTFDVKADAPRSFGVYLGEDGGNWTNLNAANYSHNATNEWKTIIIEIDVGQTFPMHKLSFEMGAVNIPMYFDNIVLEKLNTLPFPNIEIIGTSVPPYDWTAGVNMQTTDGIHYTLVNYSLIQGELKFRQNQDWSVNWGSTSFPSGFGVQNGPNIPITQGTYNILFNRLNGEFDFTCMSCFPAIGMIGSAVPPYDWSYDVKMLTDDGIMYRLENFDLRSGELRFRQSSTWITNWGGTTFPTGTGDIYSPNIQVPAGTYDITFNRTIGEYAFVPKNLSIGILGSALNGWDEDIDLQTSDGKNYTLMGQEFSEGGVKFRQANNWSINWGNSNFPSGNAYQNGPNIPIPAGKYNVYFNRIWGNYLFERMCPDPIITNVSTSLTSLWPANHKMVDVQVNYNLSDNCMILDSSITVTSNEAENGLGDGDQAPDWKVINSHLVQLRAERSGTGSGRIYTITIEAKDVMGNVATTTTTVIVPHNATGKNGSIEVADQGNGSLTATVTPNPSGQYFNLKIGSNSVAPITIRVLDMSGRMMNTLYAAKDQSVRFGENLKAGMYLVEVLQGTQKAMCRIVKL